MNKLTDHAPEAGSKLTLYHAPKACSIVCVAILKELNIPFHLYAMKMSPLGVHSQDGTLSPEQYRAKVHPEGRVPALQVGDEVITELPAIITYITSVAPDQAQAAAFWGGGDPAAKARVMEWCLWISSHFHTVGVGMLIRPERFAGDRTELYPVIQDRGRELLQKAHQKVNQKLEGKGTFPVGGAVTVVDFYLGIFWYWGCADGFYMDDLDNWAGLVRRLEERPSWREALKADGLRRCWE